MRNAARPLIIALAIAAVLAALTSGIATFLDWRTNPSGIFHGAAGTYWSVVWETWVSWFGPVLLLAAAVLVPVLLWRHRARSGG